VAGVDGKVMDEPVSVQRAGLKENAEALVSPVDEAIHQRHGALELRYCRVGFYKHSSGMHVDAGLFRYW